MSSNPFHRIAKLLAVLCLGASLAPAQQDNAQKDLKPLDERLESGLTLTQLNGFRIYGITGAFGYNSVPSNLGASNIYQYRGLTSSPSVWASLAGGYRYTTTRTKFGFTYMPSYYGRVQSSGIQAFNQRAMLDYSFQVNPKAAFYFSLRGDESTLEQLAIQQGPLGGLLGGLPTLDQLSTAAGSGLSIGSIPALDAIYYGNRTRTFSGSLGMTLRPTTRWTLDFHGSAGESRARSRDDQVAQPLIPKTVNDEADAAIFYSFTPRTRVGVRAALTEIRSSLNDFRVVTTSGSVVHNFNRFVFVAADAGVGNSQALGNSQVATGATFIANGSLGVVRGRHTFLGSYGQTVGDSYGFGAGNTRRFLGGWDWRPRGLQWGLFANAGQQTMTGNSLYQISVWSLRTGVQRAITRQIHMSASYAFVTNPLLPTLVTFGQSRHTVLVGITWSPLGLNQQPGVYAIR